MRMCQREWDRDRLVSQVLLFTDSLEEAQGKLVFVPFEGGNADSIVSAAAAAKAARSPAL